jgi:hypothetical protein
MASLIAYLIFKIDAPFTMIGAVREAVAWQIPHSSAAAAEAGQRRGLGLRVWTSGPSLVIS